MCVVRVAWQLFFSLFKKWKYTFSACYNKMVIERNWCRGLGADCKLHKTSTCSSDGSGNNAKHSEGQEFHFRIECEPCTVFSASCRTVSRSELTRWIARAVQSCVYVWLSDLIDSWRRWPPMKCCLCFKKFFRISSASCLNRTRCDL